MNLIRTPDRIRRVPNVPKNKHRMVRFSNDDWHALGWLTKRRGSDRSAVLREFTDWWLRKPGAKMPDRPSLEDVRNVPPTPDDEE